MNPFPVTAFVALALLISACGGDAIDLPAETGAPEITAFTAEPATVSPGGTSILTWEVQGNPTLLEIEAEDFYSPIDVTGETSYAAMPTETTTYVLRARNAAGSDEEEEVVGVEAVDPAE
jgi:hypothetical protein